MQVLREVKYLAGLNHKYVVRYHGAWLEYQNPVPTFATVDSTNFPAVKSSPEDSDSSSRYLTLVYITNQKTIIIPKSCATFAVSLGS